MNNTYKKGKDIFRFNNISESSPTSFNDAINDFEITEDRLDLSSMLSAQDINANNISDYIYMSTVGSTKFNVLMRIDVSGELDGSAFDAFQKADMYLAIYTNPVFDTRAEANAFGAKFLDNDLSEYILG